jgi:hypothetical protein
LHTVPPKNNPVRSLQTSKGFVFGKNVQKLRCWKGKKIKIRAYTKAPNRPFILVFFYMKLVTNALLQHPSSCGHGGSSSCRMPGSGNLPGSGKKVSFKRPVGDRVRKEEGTRNRCKLLQAVCTHIKLQRLQIGILICISL